MPLSTIAATRYSLTVRLNSKICRDFTVLVSLMAAQVMRKLPHKVWSQVLMQH